MRHVWWWWVATGGDRTRTPLILHSPEVMLGTGVRWSTSVCVPVAAGGVGVGIERAGHHSRTSQRLLPLSPSVLIVSRMGQCRAVASFFPPSVARAGSGEGSI
eukprot:scaffold31950_cov112-Isochrysis_galbana.AAC.3